ncbi:MAG: SRPBCC domain-containing protein [Candidatus Shapirobacteria bacterium]
MTISVDTIINSPIEKVWQYWNDPTSVMVWNRAEDSWHCPQATNYFELGSGFSYTMSAKDGSSSFEFAGMYTKIEPQKLIEYTMADGRKVSVEFEKVDDTNTIVTESFDTENENSVEAQRTGWQMILDNFKKYCEETK